MAKGQTFSAALCVCARVCGAPATEQVCGGIAEHTQNGTVLMPEQDIGRSARHFVAQRPVGRSPVHWPALGALRRDARADGRSAGEGNAQSDRHDSGQRTGATQFDDPVAQHNGQSERLDTAGEDADTGGAAGAPDGTERHNPSIR